MSQFPCLSVVGQPASRPGRFFVVLIQADLCPKSPGRTVPLPLLCRPQGLPAPVLLGYTVSRCSGQPFWLGGTWIYTEQWDDSASLPRLFGGKCVFVCVCGKPVSRGRKALYLRSRVRQTCTPLSSLVKLHHSLGCADEQSLWLRLLLGLCR